jgi:citrate lyase subunit beta/citryl-CoA lyase
MRCPWPTSAAVAGLLTDWHSDVAIFVRINPLRQLDAIDELRTITGPSLTGVMVPKVTGRDDVILADRILGWREAEQGLPAGSIALVPLLETAPALRDAYGIGREADRVAYMRAIAPRGGDVERALGYRWTPEGTETLALRSSVLLAARAAGVHNPVSGLWTDVQDIGGLQRFAEQTRQIGYEGMLAIHPSHIAIINQAFTLTDREIDRYQRIITAVEEGRSHGRSALVVDGAMVDEAMVVTVRTALARAEAMSGRAPDSSASSATSRDKEES